MKLWIFTFLFLAACGGRDVNTDRSATVPEAMSCPGNVDPTQGCPSPSEAAIELGKKLPPNTAKVQAAARESKPLPKIEGRCELLVRGEKSPRSCGEIKVMIRSLKEGEMRDGEVKGFGVVFADLNQPGYKVMATSEKYEITAPNEVIRPGQKVHLRLKARPRTR